MSVCPSFRMEQLGSHWTDFHEIWYLSVFFKELSRNFQFHWNLTRITGNLTSNGKSHKNNRKSHKNNGKSHKNNGKSHKNNGKSHKKSEKSHKNNGKSHKSNGKSHKKSEKSHKNNSTLHADRYTFLIISRSVLLRFRNVLYKSRTENSKHTLCSVTFFFLFLESCGVYEIIRKIL